MMHGAYVKFTNSNKKLIRVPTKIPPMAVDVSSEKEREKYRLTVRLKKKSSYNYRCHNLWSCVLNI